MLAGACVVGMSLLPAVWADGIELAKPSMLRKLVPASALEQEASQQYAALKQQALRQGALAPDQHPQLRRLRTIARRMIPLVTRYNPQAADWAWEINLIGSREINAFCMPGGKIAFYSGLLDSLQLSDDEVAMVMGHEIAHALREHGREAMSRAYGVQMATQLGSAFGVDAGSLQMANMGVEYLMTLPNSRGNENEADLIGLELAARAGYNPQAAISLWQKMSKAGGGAPPEFMSTHPSSQSRIASLQAAIPKVMPFYQQASGRR